VISRKVKLVMVLQWAWGCLERSVCEPFTGCKSGFARGEVWV
jgi:hypothetical protein